MRKDLAELDFFELNIAALDVNDSLVDLFSELCIFLFVDIPLNVEMLQLGLLVFKKDSGSSLSMHCLDDFRVGVLQLADVGLCVLYVLAHLVEHIAQMLVLDGELLFELVDDFLATLNEYTAGLINIVDFMDGRASAVLSDERSGLKTKIPANRIEIIEAAENLEISQLNIDFVVSDAAHRVQESHAVF